VMPKRPTCVQSGVVGGGGQGEAALSTEGTRAVRGSQATPAKPPSPGGAPCGASHATHHAAHLFEWDVLVLAHHVLQRIQLWVKQLGLRPGACRQGGG
jgi:hypothetical protein